MEVKRSSKNEFKILMTKLEDLKIPFRLLRSEKKLKKFKPDMLSNSTIKFNSVSVDFVFDFYDAFILGEKYPDVKVYEVVKSDGEVSIGETGTVDAEGNFCRPYGAKPVKVQESLLLQEKTRDKWSTNDLVNFGILPEMRLADGSQILVDNVQEESMIGQAFQGSFISQARGCCFSELIDALKVHYSKVKDAHKRFVWMDVFSANQPQLCDQRFSKDEQQRINDLLAFGLHDAIVNFDEVLVFFDSFNDPMPARRAWCIWELYAMAANDLAFDIVCTSRVQAATEELFLINELNVLKLIGSLNVEQLVCSNEKDRLMILKEVQNLPGGFSTLKQTITDKIRKWVLNFAYNLWLLRLDLLEQETKHSVGMIEKVCIKDDGACLYGLASLLNDFGEFDLAIKFAEAASEIFDVLQERYLKNQCNNLLGISFRAKGDFRVSLKYYQNYLDDLLEQPRKDERDIATAYSNLGLGYSDLKDFIKSEQFFDKAIELRNKIYGQSSVEVNEILINKQIFFIYQEKFEDAIKLGEELRSVVTGHLKSAVLNNLGDSYSRVGKPEEAIKCAEEVLRIDIEIFGPDHQNVGLSYLNLAIYYAAVGQLLETEMLCFKAKEIFAKNKDVFGIGKVNYNLGIVYLKQERKNEAIECFKEAREADLQIYGPESEEVQNVESYLSDLEFM